METWQHGMMWDGERESKRESESTDHLQFYFSVNLFLLLQKRFLLTDLSTRPELNRCICYPPYM